MTKKEFIDKAKEFGYKDDQIQDLLEIFKEAKSDGVLIKYEEIQLIQQPVY